MIDTYVRWMGRLHRLCLWGAGASLVVITLIVPWGVFTRYVLGYGSQWPEPMAILLMIVVSFLAAAVCYRDNLHIGVTILPNALGGAARQALGWLVELAMLATNLFMLWWGIELVKTTWFQSISEFPTLSVGITYLPIPIGGTITALFAIERILVRRFFEAPAGDSVSAAPME